MSDENVVPFSTSKTEKPGAVKFTEDFQAKAFVDIQNGNLKYVEAIYQWYIHNGNYWEDLSKLTVIKSAQLMNRGTALNLDKDPRLAKQISSRRYAQQV